MYTCRSVIFLTIDSLTPLHINRHQARENEPRDYDMNKDDVRDLGLATYKRIGNVTDGSLPNTTYQDMGCQVFTFLYGIGSEQCPQLSQVFIALTLFSA